MSTIKEEKSAFRKAKKIEIAAITPKDMADSDDKLVQSFLSLTQVEQAHNILLFWGVAGLEPDTIQLVDALTKRGKIVSLPRMCPNHRMELPIYKLGDDFIVTPFGISEPALDAALMAKETVDLVLVPALCYDRQGYRMGFGGGYYDRFLEDFSGTTVGLCRETLLCDSVPREYHDSCVDILITEGEIVLFDRK